MKCAVCGCESSDPKGKPRSIEQMRRYFKLVRLAYHHWPESHARQFASEEECRKWLQMAAGAREIGAELPLTGLPKERALLLAEMAIRAAGAYAHPVIHRDKLIVWRPKSIAFGAMGHREFCALVEAVEAVIAAETGLTAERLLQEGVAA